MLEVTNELAGCKLDGSAIVFEDSEEEIEGHIVGGPSGCSNKADNMPDPVTVDFDREEKVDGEKAQDLARSIKVEFTATDINFWFSQLEDEMLLAGVGSQWLKKTILQRNLPVRQKEDVKGFLTLPKTAAGAHIYLDIKLELIRIYAPKPMESYKKALTRTMVGLPSQLGHQLVDDICKKPVKMEGCCCPPHVQALWTLQLPVNVRSHISNREFTSATYKSVFEAADQCFLSAKQVSVAALTAQPSGGGASLDETLPAFSNQNQPQVAAVRGRGRGGGRGWRGNRGNRGGNRGGGASSGTGGGGGNSGNGGNQNQTRKRSAQMPPEECCDRHYAHGDQAWYCQKPLTCPWKDKVVSK